MSSLPMRNFVAVSFFLSCSAAFGQVQRLGAHPDSQVFQSVRRAIQEGELKVDVFEFRPTPRFVELSKKLGEFLKDYPNIAKQPRNGRRLPYDARMGISRQEYEEYLNFENRLNLKKKLTTTIDITKVSHERFRFDGRSLLPDLAIEIDFGANWLKFNAEFDAPCFSGGQTTLERPLHLRIGTIGVGNQRLAMSTTHRQQSTFP